MRKKLIAFISSFALLGGTAQGMLLVNATACGENDATDSCVVSDDGESYYKERNYYFNSDGVIYSISGDMPFDPLITNPKEIESTAIIQKILQTEDPSAKLAVTIRPECLDGISMSEFEQYAKEHSLNGMTYEEILLDYDAYNEEFNQFKKDNQELCYEKSCEEIEALFFQETTGQLTWNKPWTKGDLDTIHRQYTKYVFQLAEETIAKELERLKSLGFEIQEVDKFNEGIYTLKAITTVEQLQNFIPNDRIGYKISLQFLAPTSENSNTSNIFPVEIKTVISGDINDDGEVGVMDVVLLQKWLLGIGELPNWKNADLHKDGVINIYDLLKLKQMLIELL